MICKCAAISLSLPNSEEQWAAMLLTLRSYVDFNVFPVTSGLSTLFFGVDLAQSIDLLL